ncbi:orotidine-5'-phosphate decarboxylase [Legionella londiniensis]|uniref:Orotidine 5'-phosphate decarboxylase n=1 Tax=Legionella londiniensis TaxID=45068 RepID=A0A0W0VQB2_9GAMM|nr:orotidine-5'-phosphate decarboxylase [Legionella londiniensis]KTD22343.1 orotidine 5'-phosphate decarboxylase [Legionella londiniensis]STX93083.1 orotidine-5'-phosphate decarboxylase [Legionella londiniensis]
MSIKLIVALDYHVKDKALELVDKIDPAQCALKIGNEMFTLFGPELVRHLVKRGFKVFLDLKFHDIPNTVAKACVAAAELGVWMINVHASGGLAMMAAAKNALDEFGIKRPLLIAVTVLTSMEQRELPSIGIENSLEDQVLNLALLARRAGLDGVVSSALEARRIKEACGNDFLTVTPGIRFANTAKNDQKRTISPEQAVKLGSDFLVIGRPITEAENPSEMVKSILSSLP